MRLVRAAILALGVLAVPAVAQEPLLKSGSCPSGYHGSGDYCLEN